MYIISESLASDIYYRVEDCINLIWNDPDKLNVFLVKLTDMKKVLENDMSLQNEPQNKDGFYEDLLGIKAHDTVVIVNPKKCEYQALLKDKKDAGEVEVNESDEDEEDVEVDDVDEDDETEEYDEDEDDD
nr:hypothetical protein [Tanacetum cinerariifolium]